jgi:hypothetical protein
MRLMVVDGRIIPAGRLHWHGLGPHRMAEPNFGQSAIILNALNASWVKICGLVRLVVA